LKKHESVRPTQWVSRINNLTEEDVRIIHSNFEGIDSGHPPELRINSSSLDTENLDSGSLEQKHLEKILPEHLYDYQKLRDSDVLYFIVEIHFDFLGRPSEYCLLENNMMVSEYAGFSFPELEEFWLNVCGRVAMTGISISIMKEWRSLNRWYRIHAFRIGGDNDRKVAAVFYDITAQKHAEDMLTFKANLLSSVHAAIMAADENSIIIYWNEVAERLFGWSSREAVGKLLPEILRNAGHYSLKSDTKDERVGEASYYHKDGHIIHMEFHDQILMSEQGELRGNVTSFRDITKRRQEEQEIQEVKERALTLVEQLRQGDQKKNEFINILSHELRNPLASLMVSLSLLERVSHNPEQTRVAIESMKRQTGQLTRLVDDLLDITRISRESLELKKELIELNQLVDRIVEDYKLQFEKKGLRLEFASSPFPLYLDADAARLTQVIGNLLHNAAKFTSRGEETMVTVQRDDECSEAVISVKDQGAGMDKETLAKLFEPHAQINRAPNRSHGGLGLGLSIVKGFVELHGGKVTAFSDGIGKGAEFIIRLPIKTGMEIGLEEEPPRNWAAPPSMRILVIDDIKDIAEILASLLRNLGHSVVTASSGKKGIAMAKEFHPDVLLCDIGLPGMDGFEVARSFRNDPELKDVILIALTGYAHPDYLKLAKEAGFDRHLTKPVNLTTLEQTLAEFTQ